MVSNSIIPTYTTMIKKQPISIYIHWPFCLSLCPYCDFNSHLMSTINHDLWLYSYIKEIHHFKHKLLRREIKSIFFGGGTPSLMSAKTVAGIINYLSNLAIVSDSTEITLEANPTSYEDRKFKELKAAGINRVSIGVQSLRGSTLKTLGRTHSKDDAISSIKSAARIFNSYSFDLIYAVPNQTLKKWQDELSYAVKLADGHISLYMLTIERGTPFYKQFKSGEIILPSDESSARMYEWTNQLLGEEKYCNYEISNYATSKKECIHNLNYWNYGEYLGIGPGAHSRLYYARSIQAVTMIYKPINWLASVSKKGNGIQIDQPVSQDDLVKEIIMMGTRLKDGMSISIFNKIVGVNFNTIINKKSFDYFQKSGLVFINNTHFGLTQSGLLLHNYLIPRLIS